MKSMTVSSSFSMMSSVALPPAPPRTLSPSIGEDVGVAGATKRVGGVAAP
jgi:hypothetical protein